MDLTKQRTRSMGVGVATSSAQVGLDITNVLPDAVNLTQAATGMARNVADLAKDTTGSGPNVTGVVQDATNLTLTTANLALNITGGAAQNATSLGQDFTGLAQNLAGLAWKGAAYLYNSAELDNKLAQCMAEYQLANYLERSPAGSALNTKTWHTTPAFRDANFLLKTYKDIERYIEDQAITDAELDGLNWRATVTIYEKRTLPNIMARLSGCCTSAGVRDVTKTDMEQRFNTVSFARIGNVLLSRAFAIEGEIRSQREGAGFAQERRVVPILGRLLSLMPLCGITEISLSDITIILGKAAMFETVARSRIAALRMQHASQVMNSLLFGGSTQSTAKAFSQLASGFKGERVVVGSIDASRNARFENDEVARLCQFSRPVDRKHAVGTPVYMLDGWANLIAQRETLEKERSSFRLYVPSTSTDVHGNKFGYPGRPGRITFTVKELPDGRLMAKPRRFGTYDYLCSANYDKGRNSSKATGEEKHFGGMVGSISCGCSPDRNKGRLTRDGKYGNGLKISNGIAVGNSIEHTKGLPREKVSILWCSGDWPMGVFFMQTLPQSSYLQGRGECLYCAVENATLAGCAEVIACGGGGPRATSAASRPTNATAPASAPAARTQPLPSPAVAPAPSSNSANAPEPAPEPAVAPAPSPYPANAPEPASELAATTQPLPSPAVAPTPSPKPANAPEPAPEPAVAPTTSPDPANAPEPAPEPAATTQPLPSPAVVTAPLPGPANASAPAPEPAMAMPPASGPENAPEPASEPAMAKPTALRPAKAT